MSSGASLKERSGELTGSLRNCTHRHNKVTEHGSAHEFWSSALAEHFFLALAKYIDSLGG